MEVAFRPEGKEWKEDTRKTTRNGGKEREITSFFSRETKAGRDY